MDVSNEEWNNERDRLQNEFIAAALKLRKHMGRAGLMIPVEDQKLILTVTPIGQPLEEDEEELEQEISEDAAKLYELKQAKYVEIEVPGDSPDDPDLFVTIGPDDSPPDDEADDRP